MSTPIVEVRHYADIGNVVEVISEGRLYKFAYREDGKFRCFWWEGRFNLAKVMALNPIARRVLDDHRPAPPQAAESVRNPRHWTDRDDD